MMKKELLIIFIVLFAGMADGTKDKLQFHYGKSIFAELSTEKQSYFNPSVSWKLKYKNVEAKDYRPRFPLATSALVFLTDFWHLIKQLHEVLLFTAIAFAMKIRSKLIWAIPAYAAYKIGFYLMYNWLLVA